MRERTFNVIATSICNCPNSRFGKYKDRALIDLPEPYLVWFSGKGFPEGELGDMLRSVYEIKLNGLEYLLKPLKLKS